MPFLPPGKVSNVRNGLDKAFPLGNIQQELGQGKGGRGGEKDHLYLGMICGYTKVSMKDSIPRREISKLQIIHQCMHTVKCLSLIHI